MPKRVLIVDDFQDGAEIRQSAIAMYVNDAFEMEALFSGQECLDRLKKDPPVDLILLDIDMPAVSGADVIREVLKMKPVPALKIIPLTAWGADWPKRWGMEALTKTPEYQNLVLSTVDKAGEDIGLLVCRICQLLDLPTPPQLEGRYK